MNIQKPNDEFNNETDNISGGLLMLPMFLIMLISAIIFFPLIFTKNGRTIIGKKRLTQILNQFTKKKKGYVINNIINSKINSDNELIEFNHILVCTSGIYFIKAINLEGAIKGEENDIKWTQTLKNKKINELSNPLLEMKKQAESLKEILKINEEINSFVVFTKGNVKDNHSSALTLRQLYKKIKNNKFEILNKEKVIKISRKIEDYKEKEIIEFVNNKKCYKCGAEIKFIKMKKCYIVFCTNKECKTKAKL